MLRRVLSAFARWWNSPSLLDQFQSIHESKPLDVLELTEVYEPWRDPFGQFKRKQDALSR